MSRVLEADHTLKEEGRRSLLPMSVTPGGKRKSVQSTLNFSPVEKRGKAESGGPASSFVPSSSGSTAVALSAAAVVGNDPDPVSPMETSHASSPPAFASTTFRKVGGAAAPKRLIVKDFKGTRAASFHDARARA